MKSASESSELQQEEAGHQRQVEVDVADAAPGGLKLARILVPIDFSVMSRKALQYAVPFARRFGAKITLLYTVENVPESESRSYSQENMERVMVSARRRLDSLARTAVEADLLDVVMVHVGIPFDVITGVARTRNVDLIVISTHGYTGLKHVFLGSTAERVVRHAPCPVLVVREREHDFV